MHTIEAIRAGTPLLLTLLIGCSTSTAPPPTPVGDAAMQEDAGERTTSDAGETIAADGLTTEDPSDAGDAAVALPITVCPTAPGQKHVAFSPDGTWVAALSCAGGRSSVIVRSLRDERELVLGDAPPEAAVEWLLDGQHVLFGTPNELSVRRIDAAASTVRVGRGTVTAHRMFQERVTSTDFAPRLLTIEALDDQRRISIWSPDTGYGEGTLLLESPAIESDLSQLSASGRTLIVTPIDKAAPYVQIQWNMTQGSWETTPLSFGPSAWAMAPVGLGDTHNFALSQDRLARVELKTGLVAELVAPGSGLLPGTAHLIDREDAPGQKYVYYIQNGDPTRRDRDGKFAPIVLAQADAVAQVMTPDVSTLLYLSGGVLYAVPAEGGDARALVDTPNDSDRIEVAFPRTGKEFAYVVGGVVHRVNLDTRTSSQVAGVAAAAGTVAYAGRGARILFVTTEGDLVQVSAAGGEPEPIAAAVTAFWAIAGSAKVAFVSDGRLLIRELVDL